MQEVNAGHPPGSEVVVAMSQERRRCLGNKRARVGPVAAGAEDWRDWANLTPDLVDEIAARALAVDVAEYLLFRAVCRPWRDLTDDPRRAGALDRRFRPRNWIVLSITPGAGTGTGTRRRLLNLATAASITVDLPALSADCHLCSADGLLVLHDRATDAVRLLDPLSNAVTELPALSRIVSAAPPSSWTRLYPSAVFRTPGGVKSDIIDGACFDDSTSPPTLLLCLRVDVSNIISAKPGGAHWTVVEGGDACHWYYTNNGRVPYHSLLSMAGRCYVTSLEGSVYLVELRPRPRLVQVIDQRKDIPDHALQLMRIASYLVVGGDDDNDNGRMLMVRYWKNIEHFGGRSAFEGKEDLFTAGGITGRMELLEVDIAGKKLIPVRSLGRHAAFIGLTQCLLISTETFPSIATDAVYLGYRHEILRRFSIYHVKNGRTDPPQVFNLNKDRKLVPYARACNLDEYLMCYVNCRHQSSGACLSHAFHK